MTFGGDMYDENGRILLGQDFVDWMVRTLGPNRIRFIADIEQGLAELHPDPDIATRHWGSDG